MLDLFRFLVGFSLIALGSFMFCLTVAYFIRYFKENKKGGDDNVYSDS